MKRPNSAEQRSIQQIMEHFNWVNGHWTRRHETTRVIIRTFSRFSPNPEDPNYEEYCRIKILLHHPFRDLHSIRRHDDGEKSWRELYANCQIPENGHNHAKDTLRSWDDEQRRAAQPEDDEDEDVINQDVEQMEEVDWQLYARLHPHGDAHLWCRRSWPKAY